MAHYAIDFGTSNSLINYIDDDNNIIEIPLEGSSNILRTLFFTPSQNEWYFGNEAINEYILNDGDGRFFRSVKKFLPEPNYNGTIVHNKKMNISQIISTFLVEMKKRADKYIGKDVKSVVMGRPALYSLDLKEDQLAQDRMHEACILAGFSNVIFCPEPIAAGLSNKNPTNKDEIILIIDLGGGTSDFTLMKSGPREFSKNDILGLSGIFKAGDALDGDVMFHNISKHIGSQFKYSIPGSENILTFPRQLIKKICSPAHITHIKEKDTWEHLKHIKLFAKTEKDNKALDQLFTVVECQLGFPIFEEITKTKISLNNNETYNFFYKYPGILIEEHFTKDIYRNSVIETIERIFKSMDEVFIQAGLNYNDVDKVQLTGGTSQLKIINDIVETKFGADKINRHNFYQSVVTGLSKYKF